MKKLLILLVLLIPLNIFSQYDFNGKFKNIEATFFENDIEKFISYEPIIFTVSIDSRTNMGTITQYHPEDGERYKYVIKSLFKSNYYADKTIRTYSFKANWSSETFKAETNFEIHFFLKYNAGQIMLIVENPAKKNRSMYSLKRL